MIEWPIRYRLLVDNEIYSEYDFERLKFQIRDGPWETKTLSDDNQQAISTQSTQQTANSIIMHSMHSEFSFDLFFFFFFSVNKAKEKKCKTNEKQAKSISSTFWFEFQAAQAHVLTNFQWFDGIWIVCYSQFTYYIPFVWSRSRISWSVFCLYRWAFSVQPLCNIIHCTMHKAHYWNFSR